jgi:ornithine cyclodeaminase/alanine dehydrogenase-like protein (mu-crystallin family)
MSLDLLFLSADDVRSCAPGPDETIQIVEEVFRAHGRQQAIHRKVHVDLREKYRGHFGAFPAYVETSDGPIAGVKWLANFVKNPVRYELPAVTALITLNDLSTGAPLAILEGAHITALRTAGASAVGAKYLAAGGARNLAIIGASVQGRQHLIALNHVIRPRRATVFDVREDVKTAFADELERELKLPVEPAQSCEEAVSGAAIVVLATSAPAPFFEPGWCRSGMLLIAISGVQDLKAEVLSRVDRIVVDVLGGDEPPGALGLRPFFAQGLLTVKDVDVTMADIVNHAAVGRQSPEQVILFSPGGLGTEDIAVARRVYERAKQRGLGVRLRLH